MVVIGQGCCIRADKSGCIRAKVVVFGQKRLYSGKVVVFRQTGCVRAKLLYSGKSDACIWAKAVVLGQK